MALAMPGTFCHWFRPMKYKSALMTQASGSIAGMTASRNRGGSYLRARVVPVNPNTERQGQARANMAQIVGAWSVDLSEADRDAWTAYAAATPVIDRLGDQLILTGQQMFIKTQLTRLIAGLGIVNAGPVTAGLATTPTLSGDPTVDASSGIIYSVDVAGAAGTGTLVIYSSQPVPASRTAAHAVKSFAGVDPAATVDVFAGTLAAATLPYTYSAGQKVRVSFVYLSDDGRVSAEVFRDVIATT